MRNFFNFTKDIITESSGDPKWEDVDYIEMPNGEKIDMKQLLKDQNDAFAGVIHLFPWLRGALSKLQVVYTFHVETQATDGVRLLVNPYFTSKLTYDQKIFLICHELMHNLLQHLRREKAAGMNDHNKANIAADYEVNIALSEFPPMSESLISGLGGLIDDKYKDWSFEKIYNDPGMKSINQMQPKDNGSKGPSKSGSSQGAGSGSSGGGGGDEKRSPDWIAGWNKAVDDITNGKIKNNFVSKFALKLTNAPAGGNSDFDEGYNAAIKAWKEMQKQQGQDSSNQSGNNGSQNQDGNNGGPARKQLPKLNSDEDIDSQLSGEDKSTKDAVKKAISNSSQSGSGQSQSGSGQGLGPNTTQDGNGNTTRKVTAQDMAGQSGDMPAGGFTPQQNGQDIAKKEGYDSSNPSESSVVKEWAEEAQKAAKQMGKGHDGLKRLIDDITKTSTNWKKELRNIIATALSTTQMEYRYANKNILAAQGRLAKQDKEKEDSINYITVMVDTSGSMDIQTLRKCLNEVYTMANQKKPEKLIITMCDTQMAYAEMFDNPRAFSKDLKKITLHGGGGTDFKDFWKFMAKGGKGYENIIDGKPRMMQNYLMTPTDIAIIFTDGYVNQIPRDKKTMKNLLWVIMDNPSWELQHKDRNTRVVYLKMDDVK